MSGTSAKTVPDAGELAIASSSAVPQPSTLSLQPPPIPDHELIRRIGGGAYGEVWLARNVLGEPRAVKIIFRSRFNDPRPFEREFEGIQRFEPTSRSHPSQLAILHVGKNDAAGCFYYVMELADPGQMKNEESRMQKAQFSRSATADSPCILPSSLPQYTPRTLRHDLEQHTRLPIPDCIQIGLSLTTALAHLHQHGLVHRDIKPSNVIFVNGVPKLGDIGLVTEAGDTQSIVGTEGYIPPEGPGTPQADIFSLGKVLYEISTGLDRRRFAELPEDLRSWPDRNAVVEFNEILFKACARDAAQRYQSADEIEKDLSQVLSGKSLKRERVVKQTLRITGKATGMVALLAGFGVMFHFVSTKERRDDDGFRYSTNDSANILYKQGREIEFSSTPQRLSQAESDFTQAIRLDPNFIAPWFGLFEVSNVRRGRDDIARMHSLARDLLASAPEASASHYAQSLVSFLDWHFDEAEEQILRALQLNPRNSFAHGFHGFLLNQTGQPDRALQEYQESLRLKPEDPRVVRHLGHPYYQRRQYDKAIAQYHAALALRPDHVYAHYWIGRAYQAKGDILRAIPHFEAYEIAIGRDPNATKARYDHLGKAFEHAGMQGYWTANLQIAQTNSAERPYDLAKIHAYLGNRDQAFARLDEAYEKHQPETVDYLLVDECWDAFRTDERFGRMLKRMGMSK